MIVDWIYDHPTWMWGNILVWGAVAFACLGLAVFHRFVHIEVRRAHNDLAGFMIAIISVVYAVLLAFIAVATWESFPRRKRSWRRKPVTSATCTATRRAFAIPSGRRCGRRSRNTPRR